ncbi:MAG: TIGR04013 family B12-binding domain/radical SAM domain-containing protein [Candidatus Omnitrophica bacterium]|nr:TIGR04013 family B12-binding domain/radical SAM domain-containing protein [Candidatus Omnitrophota bacterium]MDD5488578.1 TIGR04013 family B12-binding domain/radical SAM domain-containing protein [Candidatus Omnitrophota bacterium]
MKIIPAKNRTGRKIRVLFRWSGQNRYTISYLIGVIQDAFPSSTVSILSAETLKDIREYASADTGITILAYSFCSNRAAMVKKEISTIKKDLPRLIVICGGPHATALPGTLLEAGADFVFRGEAEESFLGFLENITRTGHIPQKGIINALPLKDFNSYPPFAYKMAFFTPIEIRRGCHGTCGFCQTPRITNGIKERDMDYIVKYASLMVKAGRDRISFITPDALSYGSTRKNDIRLDLLSGMLEAVRSTGLRINLGIFPSEVSPKRLASHPEAADLLKEYVTNSKIALGGQSGSDRVLELMRRDHTVDDILRSVHILRRSSFLPVVDFILGTPGESFKDRGKTLELIRSLVKKYRIRVNLHYFIPLPGTPMGKMPPETIENSIKNAVFDLMKNGHAMGDFFEQAKFCGV